MNLRKVKVSILLWRMKLSTMQVLTVGQTSQSLLPRLAIINLLLHYHLKLLFYPSKFKSTRFSTSNFSTKHLILCKDRFFKKSQTLIILKQNFLSTFPKSLLLQENSLKLLRTISKITFKIHQFWNSTAFLSKEEQLWLTLLWLNLNFCKEKI